MKRISLLLIAAAFLLSDNSALCQQYKLKQSTGMMGMNASSTIYVKGMRKRTESGGMMGMPAPPVTIEQCDLQRTIKINDKKKLYFIEPFAKDNEEIIDEEVKTAPKPKATVPVTTTTKKGGTIYLYYNITDTGERKKMYGFTARHVWTTNKMKPSADACTMKDSIVIKTDGWYIDLPKFNCPVNYKRYSNPAQQGGPQQKPDCIDKFVTRRSGKGKLGFALTETTTIIMADGKKKTSSFETNVETLEFSAAKLDSMLFEIPPGYTQTMNEEDLQDKMNLKEMMEQYGNGKNMGDVPVAGYEEKQAGTIRIGVYPMQGEEQIQLRELQQHLANALTGNKIEGVLVADEAEAKQLNCDYSLTTRFVRIKQGSKMGGLLKAVKNADPNAASSFTIETNMTLVKLADGNTTAQPKTDGKYEGKIAEAAKKALDEGGRLVLKGVK